MKPLKPGEYYVAKIDSSGYMYLDVEYDHFYHTLGLLVNKNKRKNNEKM